MKKRIIQLFLISIPFFEVISPALLGQEGSPVSGEHMIFALTPIQTFPPLPPSGRNGSYLGEEITDIGDVNNDGFDDWAVGLKHAAIYPSGEKLGKVYIYYGSDNLVSEKDPDIILYGETDSDKFGSSVSSAGDVNNDGYTDVIVGAYWNSANGLFVGRAYLFYGGLNMDNTPDVIFNGEATRDFFGYSVSSAGDVNNDGFVDLVIGAYFNSAAGTNAGRAYLYFGGTNMDNIPDVIFTGEVQGDNFANSVTGAGDVNNDGFSDLIIGAYLNNTGGVNAGRAYIYFGGTNMNNIADVILTGEIFLGRFGISVSSAGDVNNDGYSDVIVGADVASRTFLYYGGTNMDNTADIIFSGEGVYDNFGIEVSSAGDVNNDGFSDVIIGASAGGTIVQGSAHLYFGGTNMDNTADIKFEGEAVFDNFGISVSCAGDVNNDGFSDLIAGADWNNSGGDDAGRAYLYFGGTNIDNTADIILTGEASYDYFGYSISSAGDVNNDGFADIIIGAYSNNEAGIDAGRAYLFFGGTSLDNIPDAIFSGEESSDGFGISVSTAGDVNNDGFADIIIGAYANSLGGTVAGRSYIFFGGNSVDDIPDVILTGETSFDFFGNCVSSAGDVNNDGFSDVIIGAYSNEAGGYDAGRAYIYFGGVDMDNIADIILNSEASLDNFGNSVSSAGDVNNDGFSDVIVGAYFNDAGGDDAGRAYIYFGGSNMDNLADVILTGEESLIRFGSSVSSSGDVNNDGFSDVIIGASLGGNATGRAYIYFGSMNMDNIADVIFTGENIGDAFGISVSSAGDINNDGFSDVIVGAQWNSTLRYSAGRSYLYFGGTNVNNIADAVFTGVASGDLFGICVSSAGDVNNDGFSDMIIGAAGNCAIGYQMGRAYLYSGNVISGVNEEESQTPEDYHLYQNYPNPFNPTTTIEYLIPHDGFISLKIYDILGNEIKELVNEQKSAGRHNLNFDASGLASGVYIYQVRANNFISTKKMMLLK